MVKSINASVPGLAKVYIYLVNLLGCAVLAYSFWRVRSESLEWVFLAVLASFGGFFSVKVPTRREEAESVTLTLSDVFIYVAILWYGTYVAIIISALDTLLGSLR